MENSLNSSSPEGTTSRSSVFKKPANFYQAFEVSMDESVTAAQINKSDADLDTTSSTNKVQAFKKTRKSIQQPFNVSSDESLLNSESEQSVTFARPDPVFSKKNKSIVDFFNVSYNETNVSSQADALSKTTDESNIVCNKKNPFEKGNESRNEIMVGDESSVDVSVGVKNKSGLVESQKESICNHDGEEADSTTFETKQNPFKKSLRRKSDSISQLHVSVADENKSIEDDTVEPEIHSATNNSRENDEEESSIMKSRLNPFKQNADQDCDSMTSITKQRGHDLSDNITLTDPRQSKNISLDKNISKVANSASYLEQSSINDDNLNNWMSDQSDEEMPPAGIPSPTSNLSRTKEKPVSSSPPENPVSVWEQKFNEIVSNAEKKYEAVKSKKNLHPTNPTSTKQKPFQKSDQNVDKLPEDDKKYKPPKLIRPAPFVSKKLYQYIIKKLQPKYGIDTMLESENLISSICETVKKVTRRKTHQKRLIQQLKKEMAEAGLIETTMDFYEFIIEYLPYSFRVKVVPCLQPISNVVYPPKDVLNPFDKIL